MAREMGGYRQYKKTTATATTLNQDLPAIGDGHQVYVERFGARTDKANADVAFSIVSGGQEFPVQSKLNVTANFADGQIARCWIYTGEFLRAAWSGIASADVCEFWAVGTDRWDEPSG